MRFATFAVGKMIQPSAMTPLLRVELTTRAYLKLVLDGRDNLADLLPQCVGQQARSKPQTCTGIFATPKSTARRVSLSLRTAASAALAKSNPLTFLERWPDVDGCTGSTPLL